MARINLLTIHWGNSYGGSLQTYATVRLLKSLGHKVNVINLIHPKYNKSILRLFRESRYVFVQTILFSYFRKRYIGHFTKKMYQLDKSALPDSDFYIVGSDQVWNKDITSPIDLSYFIDFDENHPHLSFSSSFGKQQWENDTTYTETVKRALKSFRAVSVREDSAVEICKTVFGINAVKLLDPTILWGDYNELTKHAHKTNQVYPFLLVKNSETDNICKIVSEEKRMPIYKPSMVEHLLKSSPIHWLKMMKASAFIVTDSFHGLAFSIIFNKEFIVLCADEKKFTRLQSLLKFLNLESRYVRSVDDLKSRKELLSIPINYLEVNNSINIEREKGRLFLEKNLS